MFNKTVYKVSVYVGLMAKNVHPVNSFFDTDEGASLIQEDILEAEWLGAVQGNSGSALKIATD